MTRMGSTNPKMQEPSMEEILASIRRIISDDQDAPEAQESVRPTSPSPLRPVPHYSKAETDSEEFDRAQGNAFPDRGEAIDEASTSSAEPISGQTEGLLSNEADASVAEAFHTLTSQMAPATSPTLEDLAKDLLRPMLREWLNDNLPSLVERLVRAEIERVSRGRV